jgi:hypothetical protein
MNEKNTKTPRSDSRYVAHFDVLGMAHAIRKNQDEAWGALSDFCFANKELDTKYGIRCPHTGSMVNDRSRTRLFSDTIVIFSLSDEIEDLYSVVLKSALLFCESLRACIPIRGGIAFGEFFINLDLDMFLGKPLIDAYRLGETSQWLGIVVDEIIFQQSSLVTSHDGRCLIVKWKLPIKNHDSTVAYKDTSVINWPAIFKPTVPLPVSAEDFYEPFKRLFGPFDDLEEEEKTKYVATVDFMNYQLTGRTI